MCKSVIQVLVVTGDISKTEDCNKIIEEAISYFAGILDILVMTYLT